MRPGPDHRLSQREASLALRRAAMTAKAEKEEGVGVSRKADKLITAGADVTADYISATARRTELLFEFSGW